jgi:O-antigen/teichoic acid export membrane protein
VALIWIVRRYKITPPAFELHPTTWWALVKAGFPFGINQVSLTLAYRFDTLVLNSYVATQVIGWYNASYNFSRSLTTFAAAFSGALVPTLAREHATNPENVKIWYYRSFRLLLFTGLPIAVGGSILADKLIPFIYGQDFQAASIAFAILVWDTLLLMFTSLGGNIAQAIQKEGVAARIFGAEAVLNLTLNLIVIPRYGMIGASFTTVATELAGALLFYRFFRREFGAGLNFRYTMRMLLAAAIMGAIVYLLHDQSMLLVIPIGMVAYLVAIGVTKALTADEQEIIIKAFRRIFQRIGRMVGVKA